jgi:hypothetical protein
MDETIRKADARYRRGLWIALVVTLVTGAIALGALWWGLGAAPARDPFEQERQLGWLFAGVCWLIALLAVLAGAWLLRWAARGQAEGRWPPQQMPVASDTRIEEGMSALESVREHRLVGATALLVGALLGAWGIWVVL